MLKTEGSNRGYPILPQCWLNATMYHICRRGGVLPPVWHPRKCKTPEKTEGQNGPPFYPTTEIIDRFFGRDDPAPTAKMQHFRINPTFLQNANAHKRETENTVFIGGGGKFFPFSGIFDTLFPPGAYSEMRAGPPRPCPIQARRMHYGNLYQYGDSVLQRQNRRVQYRRR